MTSISKFLAAAAMALSASAATAATVPSYSASQQIDGFCDGSAFCTSEGGLLEMTFKPGNVQASSKAFLQLKFHGNFWAENASVFVKLGDLVLGEVMDNDSRNDVFKGLSSGRDYGNEPVVLKTRIGQDALNRQLKNGELKLTFSTLISDTGNDSNGVLVGTGEEYIGAYMKFDTVPSPVPLPAGGALLASGLFGIGMIRSRRRRA